MATPRVRKLDANHDRSFGRGKADFLSGAESTAQRVQCNLLLLLGEYFLDTTAGTPWIQPDSTGIEPILGKMPANVAYASAQVKKTILATEGVKSITAFDLTFNRTTRNVTMTARGIDDDGDTFNVSVSTANLFST